jgi:hypothetical protein
MSSGDTLVRVETVAISFLISACALGFVMMRLRVRRPGFRVAAPLAVAFGLRLLAIAGISATGLESTLRGGDEDTFMFWARALSDTPLGHGFYPHGHYPLHTVVFALQIKLGGFSEGGLRITQVGLALMGVLLILAAVHDLAGARAARITAWVLAFEPASIFFNSILHKEPLMELAGGLMVFGASKIWRRLDLSGLLLMALAGFIAVKTRPYAGWFLISAGAIVVLHGSLRRLDRPLRAMPLVYAVIIAGFVAAPAVIQVSSKKQLTELQQSQDANADPNAGNGAANSNNLALESVDYSTRGKVFTHLPQRMLDVVVRPYPWQVANPSQQLGAVGSLFALTTLVLLFGALWRRRGEVFAVTGPFLYPMIFLLAAYALSAGNAGTSFRYRTHLVTLAVAMVVALRARPAPAAVETHDAGAEPIGATPRRGRPVALVQ